jgi:hypothetical protein
MLPWCQCLEEKDMTNFFDNNIQRQKIEWKTLFWFDNTTYIEINTNITLYFMVFPNHL